jgi:membrane protease subunit HflC
MDADRPGPDLRRRIVPVLGLIALVALALAVATPVPDNRAALVLRLGRPVRVINGAGSGSGGLGWRLPLVEHVVWLDRRLQTVALDDARITTRDGQLLAIDAYAGWRVSDPVRFYQALGTPDRAAGSISAIMGSVLRQALGRTSLADAMALARGQGDDGLRAAFAHQLAGYGVTVTDLRLSRIGLPDGAPIEAAYARMTASADADAAEVAAQGHRDAQLIRADAESRAGQIYAASFGKDPQFHDFYRAMQSYDATLAQKGSRTTIVLSPDNAYLRQFRGH